MSIDRTAPVQDVSRDPVVLRSAGLRMILPLLALLADRAGATGEVGGACVQDFLPEATCSGDQVGVETVEVVEVLDGECFGNGVGQIDATLEITLASDSDKFDPGLFLALDGGSALDGASCRHDFLTPVGSPSYVDTGDRIEVRAPFWDGEEESFLDVCGDLPESVNEKPAVTLVTVGPATLACRDLDGEGHLDLSVCVSWVNNQLTECLSVADAVPLTSSGCSCRAVVNTAVPVPGCTPLPAELCDGLDNTCEGEIDEGLPDGDTDGRCDAVDPCPAIATDLCLFADGAETGDALRWSHRLLE